MKRYCLLFLILALLTPGSLHAAPEAQSEEAASGAGYTDKSEGSSETAGDQTGEKKGGQDKGGVTLEESGKVGALKRVADTYKLSLVAETGDSHADLTWRLDAKVNRGDPVVYTVQYGLASGNYDKKQEVGKVQEYRLRGLANYQAYYVLITGSTRDKKTAFSSNEVQVVPLPQEELESTLERSFSKSTVTLQDEKDKIEGEIFKRQLKQFGYSFFKNSSIGSSLTENRPIIGDYIIGPGDSIKVSMWGSVHARMELEVDRNGEISIPKVGVVKLWGLSYKQATEAIDKAISRYYKGYELSVSLGQLRMVPVFVVGEVEAPGTYQVSSMATVVNALSMAGGPSKSGSLRTIRIQKGNKTTQEIDLYDLLLSGDRSKDIRLDSGDTIFVPMIGPVVAVAGEVKRPAIYEIKGNPSLAEVLQMAGGTTAAGYTARIQLERFEGNSARVMIDHEPKPGSLDEALAGVQLKDRDMVKVFPVSKALRQVVGLRGHVARPGEYQFKPGMRVAALIPARDDLLPDAWLESAEIIRLAPPDNHQEIITINLRKALDGDVNDNILLQEQDSLQVSSRLQKQEKRTVAVNGQVLKPGTYTYYPNMTVRDLVGMAGSAKWNAALDSAELTRMVVEKGRAKSIRILLNLGKALAGDPADNLVLLPNDTLVVRSIVDWMEVKERFVTLKGEVSYPGIYSIDKGEKLSSVVERAGGYTEKAYLRGARFTRLSVQENQQKRMEEVISKSEQEISNRQAALLQVASSREELEATKASLDGLMKSLDKLKSAKAEGRIVLHLASLEALKKSPYDIELFGGDVLEIPMAPNVVNVMGHVYNTTTLVHMPHKSLSYYLQRAGGPTRDAAEGEMYVIKADGTVMSREQSSSGIRWDEDGKRWTFGSFMSASLHPGDTVVVPQKLERLAWMREIKDLTTIISQIALTAGTVLIGLK